MGMSRKRARHLFLELARKIQVDQKKSLKGFGKTARFYDDNWRPKVHELGGYKGAWNSEIIQDLRKSVGML